MNAPSAPLAALRPILPGRAAQCHQRGGSFPHDSLDALRDAGPVALTVCPTVGGCANTTAPAGTPGQVTDAPSDHNAFGVYTLLILGFGPLEGPLARLDGSSLADADLPPSDLSYVDRVAETVSVTWSPARRKAYGSRLRREKALLIMLRNSVADRRARLSAFCGFDDPTSPRRESIEERMLVARAPVRAADA